MQGDILIPLAILAGLGLLFGTILSLAYKTFKVYKDPRIDIVEDMLPSVNCGAYGVPGCSRYVADSAPGVIEMINDLAVVNYSLNDLTSPLAAKRCPTSAIVWLKGNAQFEQLDHYYLPLGRVQEVVDKEEYYQ